MTSVRLGKSPIERPRGRLPFLQQMREARLHADAVRDSQEVVELALTGLLRVVGLDPPKEHDVSKFMARARRRLPQSVLEHLAEHSMSPVVPPRALPAGARSARSPRRTAA